VPAPDDVDDAQIGRRLRDLHERHREVAPGRVTQFYLSGRGYYPPEDAGEERDRFAVCLATADGRLFSAGDHDVPFPLHSISKVFAYALALADRRREEVLARVGVEPSGDAFNSLTFDERHHRPHNPMVNAGALVTTDLVRGATPERRIERLVDLMRVYAGDQGLHVDPTTLTRELRTADRNRAAAYLMRAEGMLDGDVEALLALYLQQCSVHVTCAQLAVMGATLANGCVNPFTGERALPRGKVRDLLSVMHTCGMYDAAGEWAYDVGVPAKSGVSGGIVAVVPGKLGIGVWSPGLDEHGNSVRGIDVCREISARLGLHIFATEAEDAVLGAAAPAAAVDGPGPAA
jgi:glutaminase